MFLVFSVSPALAASIELYDWGLNIDGDIYPDGALPGVYR